MDFRTIILHDVRRVGCLFVAAESSEQPPLPARRQSAGTGCDNDITTLAGVRDFRFLPPPRKVQDVDRYQDFLPLCSHSAVVWDTIADGGRSFEAGLVVGYGPLGLSMFQTRYMSQVSVDPCLLTIETKSSASSSASNNNNNDDERDTSDGSLFDSLTSCWKLRPVVVSSDSPSAAIIGTAVDFRVEMTVSDPVTVAVLNRVLTNVAETQVAAFHERCQALRPPTDEELSVAERFYETTRIQNDEHHNNSFRIGQLDPQHRNLVRPTCRIIHRDACVGSIQ